MSWHQEALKEMEDHFRVQKKETLELIASGNLPKNLPVGNIKAWEYAAANHGINVESWMLRDIPKDDALAKAKQLGVRADLLEYVPGLEYTPEVHDNFEEELGGIVVRTYGPGNRDAFIPEKENGVNIQYAKVLDFFNLNGKNKCRVAVSRYLDTYAGVIIPSRGGFKIELYSDPNLANALGGRGKLFALASFDENKGNRLLFPDSNSNNANQLIVHTLRSLNIKPRDFNALPFYVEFAALGREVYAVDFRDKF